MLCFSRLGFFAHALLFLLCQQRIRHKRSSTDAAFRPLPHSSRCCHPVTSLPAVPFRCVLVGQSASSSKDYFQIVS
uniref:Putative secreted protein n=1 Tax=Anopheles aquasalis TaxID=42839 RepID=T1DNU0_ANOAQ